MTTRPPSGAGRTRAAALNQRRTASSPARRFSRRSSESPSSRSAAAYPPAATGSAPTVATTRALAVRDCGLDVVPGGGDHGVAGKRPAQFLGGPQRPGGAAPEPGPVAVHAAPVRSRAWNTSGTAAQPSCRGPGDRQRTAAGGAARRFAAGFAGQRRRVAGPGHLDQDRPAFEALLGGPPGGAGQPCDPGQRVALLLEAVRGVEHARDGAAHHGAIGFDGTGPAGLHQPLGLRAAGVPGQQAGGALLFGAQQQDLAGVGVRGRVARCGDRRRRPSRPPGPGSGPARTRRSGCRRPPRRRR